MSSPSSSACDGYGIPVFLVRVMTVAAGIVGFGLIFYLVLWVLMPKEG